MSSVEDAGGCDEQGEYGPPHPADREFLEALVLQLDVYPSERPSGRAASGGLASADDPQPGRLHRVRLWFGWGRSRWSWRGVGVGEGVG